MLLLADVDEYSFANADESQNLVNIDSGNNFLPDGSHQAITWTTVVYHRWGPPVIHPLRAKFFRGIINIYLHFMSLLHIDMTLKILPHVRPGPTYTT